MKQIMFLVSIHLAFAAHAYGIFPSIEYPGAVDTAALGTDGNKIVGWYEGEGQTNYHGFYMTEPQHIVARRLRDSNKT